MHLLHLTFLHFMLTFFSGEPNLENSLVSPTKDVKSITVNDSTKSNVAPGETNLIYQSMDGGKTWQDISYTLPENEEPEFYAGEAGLYLRVKNKMYHSKSNLKTPVWENEGAIDPRINSLAFNSSGVIAYGRDRRIYKKVGLVGWEAWSPVYPTLEAETVRTVLEMSDGTVLVGDRHGIYKSVDKGKSWTHDIKHGWVANLVESKGVVIGTHPGGIARSTDNGEHWYYAIKDVGAGIAVEVIDGGFAAISSDTKTKSRSIHVSFDTGKTWNRIDAGLPPSPNISSIQQIGRYLICGHPDGIFRSSDMGKTWNMVHGSVDNTVMASTKPLNIGSSDENAKVFYIYVSGNVVYAVARGIGGC